MLRKASSQPAESERLPATHAWRGPLPGIAHSPRPDDANPARISTPRTPAAEEQTPRGGSAAPIAEHRPLQPALRRGDGAGEVGVLRSRGQVRGVVALLGPAFVAAVAYVDPGNFATNFTAGAQFGYRLAWVIAAANLMAMLVQYLSAKAGVATGRDLPQLCRQHLPAAVSAGLWVQAELVAMATDLAEFVGAAIGLNLLFGLPLLPAGLVTAAVAFGILALDQRGYRRFELAIAALLGLVLVGFAYDLAAVRPSPAAITAGLIPRLGGGHGMLLLAAGIIGATVMPHVVYLHSALTKSRVRVAGDAERRQLMRYQRIDVAVALGAAGLINLAMLCTAAALFRRGAATAPGGSLQAAHADLGRLAGGGAALAFAIALLASGLSSSSVGTYAGQVVMQGFIGRRIPLYLRRAITMIPALAILAAGLPPTATLVISQVILSFGIPLALIPLILLTRRTDIMGTLANRPLTTWTAAAVAGLIIVLNGYLLYATLLQ